MEGPAQAGEGSSASAPARTAATGNSAVSGRSVYSCMWQHVCNETRGKSPGGGGQSASHPVNNS